MAKDQKISKDSYLLKAAVWAAFIIVLAVNRGFAVKPDATLAGSFRDGVGIIYLVHQMNDSGTGGEHGAAAMLLVLAVYLAMLVVPFVPAARELFFPRDEKELYIRMDYTKDPRYFGKSFRRIINRVLKVEDDFIEGKRWVQMPLGGDEFVILTRSRIIDADEEFSDILYVVGDMRSARGVRFKSEVYVIGRADIGPNNTIRAIACDRALSLGSGSRIIRWLDAEQEVEIESGCDLGVNCSTEGVLKLAKNCRFLRLFGKPVMTYNYIEMDYYSDTVRLERRLPEVVSTIDDIAMFVKGKITLPPYMRVDRDMIVKGDLATKEEVIIGGSLTVYGKTVIGENSYVYGNIFSEGPVEINRGAVILGNIFSQSEVLIKEGVRVGKPDVIKSVVGKKAITLGANVGIYGYILTEGKGAVV